MSDGMAIPGKRDETEDGKDNMDSRTHGDGVLARSETPTTMNNRITATFTRIALAGFTSLLVHSMLPMAWATNTPADAPQVLDRIAAVVNEEVITLGDVHRTVEMTMGELLGDQPSAHPGSIDPQLLHRALDEMIKEALILHEADRLQVQVGEEEINGFIANVKRQYGWDDQRLEEVISSQGTSLAAYRRDIERRLKSSRLVQIRVGSKIQITDEEVNEVFRRQYGGQAKSEEVQARHILIALPPDAAPEAEREASRRILEARSQLNDGADFVETARQISEGPAASRGGDLGFFRRGSLEPAFEDAAFDAKTGEVVGPVRTPFGLHLIQVTDRRFVDMGDPTQLKEKIRNRLYQQAMERQMNSWIEELRGRAFVDIRL